ncbi:MAG: SDR family oxidoreductase [Planctomycetota bacterium]
MAKPAGQEQGGRVVLVTGGARGIGQACARSLRAQGERVHVVWRTPGEEADLAQAEFGACAHHGDLLHLRDARRLVREVVETDGGLDAVVHAVGEYTAGRLEECAPTDLRRMLASNAETAFLLFDAAREPLRARRGRAVFFGCGGLAGLRARRIAAAFAAAKSALLVLVRSWAVEEAPHGVTVNMVSPGCIPHAGAHPDTLDPARHARIPAGRPGTLEDVTSAVGWLLSPAAAYVTGTDLQVGGGWML